MKRTIFPFLMIIISAVSLSAQTFTVTSEVDYSKLDLNYTHVIKVKATMTQENSWRFDVTLRHGDKDWDHYSNLWIVVDAETEEEYGRRVLGHPHVNEQPFTRSQSGIQIPEDADSVIVRAACNVHGFGGTELEVNLRQEEE